MGGVTIAVPHLSEFEFSVRLEESSGDGSSHIPHFFAGFSG
jgi:hypothetical protein